MAEPFRVPGRRQLPGELQRSGLPPAGEHCLERRPLRRTHADQRRHEDADSAGLQALRPGAALRQLRLAGRQVRLERQQISARCRSNSIGRRRSRSSPTSSAGQAKAPRTPASVEVPFRVIAPKADDWWTGDSRGGIDVPLGRPAPRSNSIWTSATAPRNTCSSPARPARASRRCCTC